jgi:hypothetical protein
VLAGCLIAILWVVTEIVFWLATGIFTFGMVGLIVVLLTYAVLTALGFVERWDPKRRAPGSKEQSDWGESDDGTG